MVMCKGKTSALRITERKGLERGTFKVIQFQPPCYRQGHLLLDQTTQSPIHPGLGWLRWGLHDSHRCHLVTEPRWCTVQTSCLDPAEGTILCVSPKRWFLEENKGKKTWDPRLISVFFLEQVGCGWSRFSLTYMSVCTQLSQPEGVLMLLDKHHSPHLLFRSLLTKMS